MSVYYVMGKISRCIEVLNKNCDYKKETSKFILKIQQKLNFLQKLYTLTISTAPTLSYLSPKTLTFFPVSINQGNRKNIILYCLRLCSIQASISQAKLEASNTGNTIFKTIGV